MKKLSLLNKQNRNPNIDFIRILGLFAIIIHHLLLHGKGYDKFKEVKELRLLDILCMWHVCSFGLVSGIMMNKSHNFSNLLYLWILVVFYSLCFYIKFNKNKTNTINFQIFLTNLFPVIHNKYWYFTSYFGIYAFLPFINESMKILPQIKIKKIIYFMIWIFFIWTSFYKDSFSLNSGKSPISLLILYIFGAYIGKFIFFKKQTNFYKNLVNVLCAIIYLIASLSIYNVNIKNIYPKINLKIRRLLIPRINSFPILLEVFSIIIIISQINFHNYLSRIITFIGPLTFDIYLIHDNQYIRWYYINNSFNKLPNNLSLLYIIISIFKRGLIIFIICLFISYIRNIIFKILQIKRFCVICDSIFDIIINSFI